MRWERTLIAVFYCLLFNTRLVFIVWIFFWRFYWTKPWFGPSIDRSNCRSDGHRLWALAMCRPSSDSRDSSHWANRRHFYNTIYNKGLRVKARNTSNKVAVILVVEAMGSRRWSTCLTDPTLELQRGHRRSLFCHCGTQALTLTAIGSTLAAKRTDSWLLKSAFIMPGEG